MHAALVVQTAEAYAVVVDVARKLRDTPVYQGMSVVERLVVFVFEPFLLWSGSLSLGTEGTAVSTGTYVMAKARKLVSGSI